MLKQEREQSYTIRFSNLLPVNGSNGDSHNAFKRVTKSHDGRIVLGVGRIWQKELPAVCFLTMVIDLWQPIQI